MTLRQQDQAEENARLSRAGVVGDDVGRESEPLVEGDRPVLVVAVMASTRRAPRLRAWLRNVS